MESKQVKYEKELNSANNKHRKAISQMNPGSQLALEFVKSTSNPQMSTDPYGKAVIDDYLTINKQHPTIILDSLLFEKGGSLYAESYDQNTNKGGVLQIHCRRKLINYGDISVGNNGFSTGIVEGNQKKSDKEVNRLWIGRGKSEDERGGGVIDGSTCAQVWGYLRI